MQNSTSSVGGAAGWPLPDIDDGTRGDNTKRKIRKIARQCLTQLAPWGSIWGALAAQEAVKIIGKYTPFQQMLVQEIADISSSIEQPPNNTPNNTMISEIYSQRTGFLKVLFGEAFCEKSANLQ